MKRILWDIDKIVAIPFDNVKVFNIHSTRKNGKDVYQVLAYYVIANGLHAVVFESENKEDCIDFINNIYKEA